MSGALVALTLLGVYGWGLARARRRWRWYRGACFAAGCAALGAALGAPLDATLPGHMVQHLVVTAAAPALLALGAPVRLALAALPAPQRRALGRGLHHPAVRVLAHPAVASVLAAAVVLAVHLTGLFDAAESSPVLHGLEHAALFWTALLAWIAVLGVDPLPHAPGAIGALAWISLSMVAMTAVGAVLTSAASPLYSHEPSLAAQRDAGAVMWLGGPALLVPAAIAVAMWALAREEHRQRRRESVAGRAP